MLQTGLCCKLWEPDFEQIDGCTCRQAAQGAPCHRLSEAAGVGTGSAQAEWQQIAPSAPDSISSGTHSGGEPSFGEQGIRSTCMAQQLWAGCLP